MYIKITNSLQYVSSNWYSKWYKFIKLYNQSQNQWSQTALMFIFLMCLISFSIGTICNASCIELLYWGIYLAWDA